jgi:hypothetical protein
MNAFAWILFLIVAAAAGGYAIFIYRKRETPGRGRNLLAGLRALTLMLLLLLVFNPELPSRDRDARRAPAVLLDGSLSMSLPTAPGAGTRWEAAREEARRAAGGAPVWVFEQQAQLVAPPTLARMSPGNAGARLLPALRAAAESGARRVIVVTDGRIEDPGEVARWLPALQLDVEFRTIPHEIVPNRAVVELETPSWAEAGSAIDVRYGVTAIGDAGDSAHVRIEQDGVVLGEHRVALPGAGRTISATLSVVPRAPATGGNVRLDVVLSPPDAIPDDDRRSAYVYVSDDPAGVALISFLPDWEPRFLEPVLAQSLGLPVRGYLRVGDEGYRRTGTGLAIGAATGEADVRREAAAADLLVLHGLDAASPAWARELAGSHRRVLAFAGPAGNEFGLPVRLAAPLAGEWYPTAELAPSPIAPLLAGVQTVDAAPLGSVRPATREAAMWTPLEVTQGRQGAPLPAVVAGETAGRRWALATGSGYWQWALRGGGARQLYTRLWGSLAGWLAHDHATADGAMVRPLRRAVERGGSIAWSAPGMSVDSFAVRLTGDDGVARDTVLPSVRGDSVPQAAPPPGRYVYEVDAYTEDGAVASGSGELVVESYSPEFTRSRVELADVSGGEVAVGPRGALPGRPLRAGAAPYILIVLLLAVEWVLRRRWGLR